MTIKTADNNHSVTTRFAPSPTGIMHIGNARTALFSYLFAKHEQGRFLLRVEDTDKERSKQEYIDALFDDLDALGIDWDSEVVYQSKRTTIYEKFYEQLQEKDLIYRCFCSEEKLNIMRKIQLSQGLPPRYASTCLNLTTDEVNQKLANNEPYCWRFKVPRGILVEFDDLIKGRQTFSSNDFGDFIIRRQDGTSSFMFCSAIDDVLQGVTHVLRAEDHVSNTPRQLLILQALGLNVPKYGHFCLLVNGEDGAAKLSKRSGSQSIRNLLSEGYLPLALLNYLSRLGHNYSGKENHLCSLEELYLNFNIKHTTSNSAKHDVNHLKFWQKQAMLIISNPELLNILKKNIDFSNIIKNKHINASELEEFLSLIKTNILMPSEGLFWLKILFADNLQELSLSLDAQQAIKKIDNRFLEIVILNNEFTTLCNQLKSAGFIGKALFINLRLIFTGLTSGPELNKIFEIIGSTRIQNRAKEILLIK